MARKHMVVCSQCGRQFDANKGGYYNRQSRRYTCLQCGNRIKRAANETRRARNAERRRVLADEREQRTGMRQSIGSMITKIVFGILFIYAGLTKEESALRIIIGVSLLAWGLIPFVKARLKQSGKRLLPSFSSMKMKMRIKEDNRNIARNELRNDPWICRWCGATTSGDSCEFCGRAKGK